VASKWALGQKASWDSIHEPSASTIVQAHSGDCQLNGVQEINPRSLEDWLIPSPICTIFLKVTDSGRTQQFSPENRRGVERVNMVGISALKAMEPREGNNGDGR
jgi:hypothetical protein